MHKIKSFHSTFLEQYGFMCIVGKSWWSTLEMLFFATNVDFVQSLQASLLTREICTGRVGPQTSVKSLSSHLLASRNVNKWECVVAFFKWLRNLSNRPFNPKNNPNAIFEKNPDVINPNVGNPIVIAPPLACICHLSYFPELERRKDGTTIRTLTTQILSEIQIWLQHSGRKIIQ